MEKMDGKLTEMRELYSANTEEEGGGTNQMEEDPFYETTESHNLIGVANVFLGCLFHEVVFDYYTPIISQQGEVAGRLQVQIQRTTGGFTNMDRMGNTEGNQETNNSEGNRLGNGEENGNAVTVKVTVKQASGP